MVIKILGTGCKKCETLQSNVLKAINDKEDIKVEKVKELKEIMKYNVLQTPALVVNENVVSVGKVLKENEIEELIREYI